MEGLGEMTIIWLKYLINRMLVGARMPGEERTSTVVLIFKGDVQVCTVSRGLKFSGHEAEECCEYQ